MSTLSHVFFDLLGELIGQPLDDPRYFWGRPCNASRRSSGSEGSDGAADPPSSPSMHWRTRLRIDAFRNTGHADLDAIPAELLSVTEGCFCPLITVEAADFQIERVGRARGLSPERLRRLVRSCTELTSDGQQRVNVLGLNSALDDMRARISDNGLQPVVEADHDGAVAGG